jgi:predicted short-subunit dehydrogenase-like oxidoreductase (DUF2520 family)
VTETFGNAEIGILGTGRVAKALGALLVRRGATVVAVAGRSDRSAHEAVEFIGGGSAVSIEELPRHAGSILIAVTDGAISEVARRLVAGGLTRRVVLHTSGAAGLEVLDNAREAGNSVGVLHPLQSIPTAARGVETLPGITYAFAGDDAAAALAERLISRLGGRGLRIDPKFWHHYHAGAVMACNFQMTLVDAALELMGIAGISRSGALEALGPILRTTTENVLASGPEGALTGPIRRGEVGTLQRHLAAVEDASPQTKELYRAAALRTIPVAERAGLDACAAREVAKALGANQ